MLCIHKQEIKGRIEYSHNEDFGEGYYFISNDGQFKKLLCNNLEGMI